jgi:hypothetical protein
MKLVYVSEPSWFEKPLPNWIYDETILVITDSDTVVNECYSKNINFTTIGDNLNAQFNQNLLKLSLDQEIKLLNKFDKVFENDSFYSEIFKGISNIFYSFQHYLSAFESVINQNVIEEVYFVLGERFFGTPEETPKGSFLQYSVIRLITQKRGIKMKIKFHSVYNFSQIRNGSKRYDFYFQFGSQVNHKLIETKETDKNNESKYKVLFLYQYEACKDDLEPLLENDQWPNNTLIYKGKLTSNAPEIYNYDFDFSDNQKNQILNEEEILKIQKCFNIIYADLETILKLNSKEILTIFFGKYKSRIIDYYVNTKRLVNEIDQEINRNKIDCIVLTAFSGPPSSAISAYFAKRNIKVILRQHGEISLGIWPLKCFVKGVHFSTISNYYGDMLNDYHKDYSIHSRKFKLNPIKKDNKKNTILISNDLFLFPTNKLLYINFFSNFIESVSEKWEIVLRSHPRYSGNLLPDNRFNRIKYESASEVPITLTLSKTFILIMPACSFSSVISDAILNRVPAAIIAPKGLKNIDFMPFCLDYPFIFDNVIDLNKFIARVIEDEDFKNQILNLQLDWRTKIVGSKTVFVADKNTNPYTNNKADQRIGFLNYSKLYFKNLIKSFISFYQIKFC